MASIFDKEVYSSREVLCLMAEMYCVAITAKSVIEKDVEKELDVDSKVLFMECMKSIAEYEDKYPDDDDDAEKHICAITRRRIKRHKKKSAA